MLWLIFSLVGLLFAVTALVVSLCTLRKSRQVLRESGGLPTQKQLDIAEEISNRQFDLMGIVMHARVKKGGTTDAMVTRARVLRDEIKELKQQQARCAEVN